MAGGFSGRGRRCQRWVWVHGAGCCRLGLVRDCVTTKRAQRRKASNQPPSPSPIPRPAAHTLSPPSPHLPGSVGRPFAPPPPACPCGRHRCSAPPAARWCCQTACRAWASGRQAWRAGGSALAAVAAVVLVAPLASCPPPRSAAPAACCLPSSPPRTAGGALLLLVRWLGAGGRGRRNGVGGKGQRTPPHYRHSMTSCWSPQGVNVGG